MEIAVVVFIGIWLSAACVLAYRQLKKDYQNELDQEGNK